MRRTFDRLRGVAAQADGRRWAGPVERNVAGTFHVPSLFAFRLVTLYSTRTGGTHTRHGTRSVPATLPNSPFPEQQARPMGRR